MMPTKILVATVLLAGHLAAAKCPVYMHDVNATEIKELTPLGLQILTFEPQRIDKRFPDIIVDPKKWKATITPVCAGKPAYRFLVKYTLKGKTIERYVETKNVPDPKTCKKWNEPTAFLEPKYLPNDKTPQRLTCAGPWKKPSDTSKDKVLKEQLIKQVFGNFYQPMAAKENVLKRYACKEGIEILKYSTVGACLKKPAATLEVGKETFGPKDNVAAVWGVVKYACTESTDKEYTVSLRSIMPYLTFCDYEPTPSPPL